jgi:hypothetical protein
MHPVPQSKDSLQLFTRMQVPDNFKESDDLRSHLRGKLQGEPYLHAKSDDCGACDFRDFGGAIPAS